ncbi:hypothetical protein L226DRAFT_610778 [Lentinus tigrinus ALCF2SS1-7]|uniref:Ser-Thr-rich glycosyl-phosphatidyl-inositol-anchored membrane family-domain-containing protein n=1 Tax=Lentinus tigrinus ALCF2SS1-6 TaxID=1328759 RepID=A0A5C2SHZ6_9APHY|nr:hypothetical protein L227DRAFT_599538 [Lentinus tigrinus ALCF2SS1-6]RPD77477.1 hypothetical protein L226DRAFT_610778 [Lentinus tigrinus ALCF2SS1-7]
MILSVLLLAVTAVYGHVLVPRADPDLPTITVPGSQSRWTPGQVETIEWVTKDLNLRGLNGTVFMGYFQSDGTTFLWEDEPLAQNVSLADGAVNVRCPFNLPSGDLYFISLTVDGSSTPNLSAGFVIQATNESSTALPSLLSTSGNVPSATITRTSVIGTIPAATTSSSSSSGTSSTSTSSTSSSAAPSATGGSNGGSRNFSGCGTFAIALTGVLAGAIGIWY